MLTAPGVNSGPNGPNRPGLNGAQFKNHMHIYHGTCLHDSNTLLLFCFLLQAGEWRLTTFDTMIMGSMDFKTWQARSGTIKAQSKHNRSIAHPSGRQLLTAAACLRSSYERYSNDSGWLSTPLPPLHAAQSGDAS